MTTGRRPGRPQKPISRDALLGAAIRVFARDGFAAARLADIAREIGITKGALAYHFATKEALYLEVMQEITRGFASFVQGALRGDGPWLQRLDGLGAAVVRVLGTQPDLARLILRELIEGPYVSGPGRPVVSELLDAITAFLAQGIPPERDARQLAGTIVALHFGWFGARELSSLLLQRDPTDPHEIERRVEAVVAQVRALCGVPYSGRGHDTKDVG
jgi:AcrR family transcriptional regulator